MKWHYTFYAHYIFLNFLVRLSWANLKYISLLSLHARYLIYFAPFSMCTRSYIVQIFSTKQESGVEIYFLWWMFHFERRFLRFFLTLMDKWRCYSVSANDWRFVSVVVDQDGKMVNPPFYFEKVNCRWLNFQGILLNR